MKKSTAGITPGDPMLAEIADYADFPRTEAWIETNLRKTYELPDRRSSSKN